MLGGVGHNLQQQWSSWLSVVHPTTIMTNGWLTHHQNTDKKEAVICSAVVHKKRPTAKTKLIKECTNKQQAKHKQQTQQTTRKHNEPMDQQTTSKTKARTIRKTTNNNISNSATTNASKINSASTSI